MKLLKASAILLASSMLTVVGCETTHVHQTVVETPVAQKHTACPHAVGKNKAKIKEAKDFDKHIASHHAKKHSKVQVKKA